MRAFAGACPAVHPENSIAAPGGALGHHSPRPVSHRGNVSALQVFDLDDAVRLLA
jgi:hypothetical protein